LKVWPRREPVRRLRPDAFNPIIPDSIGFRGS